jgi:hypothetical protein
MYQMPIGSTAAFYGIPGWEMKLLIREYSPARVRTELRDISRARARADWSDDHYFLVPVPVERAEEFALRAGPEGLAALGAGFSSSLRFFEAELSLSLGDVDELVPGHSTSPVSACFSSAVSASNGS